MKKEDLEFVFELTKKIADTYKQFRNNECLITLEHHESKDYYTIDFELSKANSEYKDCIVFYLTEDSFNPTEIIDDFDSILRKAETLLE